VTVVYIYSEAIIVRRYIVWGRIGRKGGGRVVEKRRRERSRGGMGCRSCRLLCPYNLCSPWIIRCLCFCLLHLIPWFRQVPSPSTGGLACSVLIRLFLGSDHQSPFISHHKLDDSIPHPIPPFSPHPVSRSRLHRNCYSLNLVPITLSPQPPRTAGRVSLLIWRCVQIKFLWCHQAEIAIVLWETSESDFFILLN